MVGLYLCYNNKEYLISVTRINQSISVTTIRKNAITTEKKPSNRLKLKYQSTEDGMKAAKGDRRRAAAQLEMSVSESLSKPSEVQRETKPAGMKSEERCKDGGTRDCYQAHPLPYSPGQVVLAVQLQV